MFKVSKRRQYLGNFFFLSQQVPVRADEGAGGRLELVQQGEAAFDKK